MGAGRSFATGMTTGVDGDDVLEDIFGLFDDTIGDEPVVKTSSVGRGRLDTRCGQASWDAVCGSSMLRSEGNKRSLY